jgi:hypothetical protein
MVLQASQYNPHNGIYSGINYEIGNTSDADTKNFSLEFLVGAGVGIAGLILLQWLLGSGSGHHYSNYHRREDNIGVSGLSNNSDYRKIQDISDIAEKLNAGKVSNLEIATVDRNNNPKTIIESDTERGNFQDVTQDYNSKVKSVVVYSSENDGTNYSISGITQEYNSKNALLGDIEGDTETNSKEDESAADNDESEESNAVESENASE